VTGVGARLGLNRLSADLVGLLLGSLGMVGFSLTLPITRLAVAELDPTVVGLGRALVAAVLAVGLLLARRERLPTLAQLRGLAVAGAGVVVGFPWFSALALRLVDSSHGAVLTGLLPIATALGGVLLAGERPSGRFWLVSLVGLAAVLLFAASMGGGAPQVADLLLLAAVASAGIGYAEGGRLARELGGWRVICWALLLTAPFNLVPVAWSVAGHGLAASPLAWLAFGYVSLVSMFLAFFAWYHGLAVGGIARVGQLQLAQPVLTLVWAALFLHETVNPETILAALAVVATVAIGRKVR
jgi:drug/metabolite transporter (DMT)-like permease